MPFREKLNELLKSAFFMGHSLIKVKSLLELFRIKIT